MWHTESAPPLEDIYIYTTEQIMHFGHNLKDRWNRIHDFRITG